MISQSPIQELKLNNKISSDKLKTTEFLNVNKLSTLNLTNTYKGFNLKSTKTQNIAQKLMENHQYYKTSITPASHITLKKNQKLISSLTNISNSNQNVTTNNTSNQNIITQNNNLVEYNDDHILCANNFLSNKTNNKNPNNTNQFIISKISEKSKNSNSSKKLLINNNCISKKIIKQNSGNNINKYDTRYDKNSTNKISDADKNTTTSGKVINTIRNRNRNKNKMLNIFSPKYNKKNNNEEINEEQKLNQKTKEIIFSPASSSTEKKTISQKINNNLNDNNNAVISRMKRNSKNSKKNKAVINIKNKKNTNKLTQSTNINKNQIKKLNNFKKIDKNNNNESNNKKLVHRYIKRNNGYNKIKIEYNNMYGILKQEIKEIRDLYKRTQSVDQQKKNNFLLLKTITYNQKIENKAKCYNLQIYTEGNEINNENDSFIDETIFEKDKNNEKKKILDISQIENDKFENNVEKNIDSLKRNSNAGNCLLSSHNSDFYKSNFYSKKNNSNDSARFKKNKIKKSKKSKSKSENDNDNDNTENGDEKDDYFEEVNSSSAIPQKINIVKIAQNNVLFERNRQINLENKLNNNEFFASKKRCSSIRLLYKSNENNSDEDKNSDKTECQFGDVDFNESMEGIVMNHDTDNINNKNNFIEDNENILANLDLEITTKTYNQLEDTPSESSTKHLPIQDIIKQIKYNKNGN